MPTSTLTRPRPAIDSSAPAGSSVRRPPRPFTLMLAGAWLVTAALAASALVRPVEHPAPEPAAVAAAPVGARSATALTLNGPNDVSVVTQVYEAGESSGWHRHTGIHAVAVLSGTLTVYDDRCHAQLVVPGRPYVGGQDLHLARNETTSPVEMVVTYLNAAGTANSTVHAGASPCPGAPA
jgi:quercetin dioxygenase-like cupin family protein